MSTQLTCHRGHTWDPGPTPSEKPRKCPMCGSAPLTTLLNLSQEAKSTDLRTHLTLICSIFDNMGDGLVVVDRQGQFLVFNQAAREIIGLGAADVPVHDWPRHYGLYDPQSNQLYDSSDLPLAKAMRGDETHQQEILIRNERHPEGIYISVTAHPLETGDDNDGIQGGVAVFRDITEQYRASAALERSEEQFRMLFDLSPDAVFVEDYSGTILDVNRTGCALHGLGRDRIVGQHFTEFIPEPARETALRGFEKMVRGELTHVDGYSNGPTGTAIPVEIVTSRIIYQGTPALLLHVRNVAEQKRDQAQLLKLFQAVEQTADGVLITDASGTIEYTNRGFEEQTGYTRDEVTGRTIDLLSADGDTIQAQLQQTIRSLEVFRGRIVNRTKEGATFPCHVTISPILDGAGNLGHLVVTWKDDSEQERKQEELRTSRERFELAVQGSRDGIWDWNVKTNEVYFSPRWKGMLGYEDDELESTFDAWAQRIHPEDRDATLQRLYRYLHRELDEYEVDHRMLHKDGTYRWIRSRGVALFDEAGNPYRMSGSHTDITNRKQDEVSLRNAVEQAEQANKAKSQFLAKVSHEMKTPLHGILGMAQNALKTEPSDEQRVCLEHIQQSTRNLDCVVDDLLDFSKLDAGGLKLEVGPFSLAGLVEECIEAFEPAARQKGLRLEHAILGDIPDHLEGDRKRLRQVLLNTLSNAVKFTDSGHVRFQVRTTSGSESASDQIVLHFVIEDTGKGIAPEQQSIMFEPFVQVDGSFSRSQGGIGLGSSISQRLVELMQGSLQVRSELGKGSTFQLTVPLRALPDQERSSATESAQRRLKLLIAEDCVINQKVITSLLQRMGHDIVLASDGEQAVAAYRTDDFDAIFMDVSMPNVDGIEATRRIRADEGLVEHPIPIIALTAHARNEDRELCLENGMSDYLTKPLESEDLENVVARLQAEARPETETQSGAESRPTANGKSEVPILDEQEALQYVGGDVQLLSQLVNLFCEDVPKQLETARKSLDSGDLPTLQRAAHTIKGGSSTIGAAEVRALALQLETDTKAKRTDTAGELILQIERAADRLRETVAQRYRSTTESTS